MRPLPFTMLACLLASHAHGLTIESLKNQQGDFYTRARIEIYLIGVGQAFVEANATLEQNGFSPLFCPPRRYRLNAKNFLDIVMDMDRRDSLEPSSPVPKILLRGLREIYPC